MTSVASRKRTKRDARKIARLPLTNLTFLMTEFGKPMSPKAGMAQPAMRYELTVNAPLAQYFCQIVAQSMKEAA